jgi:hypothetical protein
MQEEEEEEEEEFALQGGDEALCHGALCRALPVLPIEATIPTSSRRLPNEMAL